MASGERIGLAFIDAFAWIVLDVNTLCFGLPQARRRLYFIGFDIAYLLPGSVDRCVVVSYASRDVSWLRV